MYCFFIVPYILYPSFLPFLFASLMREDKKDKESEEKEKDMDKKGGQDFEHYNKQSKKLSEKIKKSKPPEIIYSRINISKSCFPLHSYLNLANNIKLS